MVRVSLVRGGAEPDSGRAKRVARQKREFVLQLFLRQGRFWDAVKEARGRCGFEGKVGMPPGGQDLQVVFAMENLDWSPLGEKVRKGVLEEVIKLGQMIPDTLQDEFLQREWGDFLTACVIFDPPSGKLIEFAEYGGPTWISSSQAEVGEKPQRKHAAAPIRVVRDPHETEIKRVVHLVKLVDEIDKAHPEITAWDFVEEKGLFSQFRSAMEEIPRRFYIEVQEDTTEEDVKGAYRVLRDIQKGVNERGGASTRDPLVAVQCAVLYDHHNERDPQDTRRKKWTYKKLAKEFGLPSAQSAEAHVSLGRKLLQAKP